MEVVYLIIAAVLLLIAFKVFSGQKSGQKLIDRLISKSGLNVYLVVKSKDDLRFLYKDARFINDLVTIFKDTSLGLNLGVNINHQSAECSIEFITNELISDVIQSNKSIEQKVDKFVEKKRAEGINVYIISEFDDVGRVIKSKFSYMVPIV